MLNFMALTHFETGATQSGKVVESSKAQSFKAKFRDGLGIWRFNHNLGISKLSGNLVKSLYTWGKEERQQ